MDISNINGISTGDIKSFFNNTSLTKTDKTDSFSDVLSAAMGSIGETNDLQNAAEQEEVRFALGESDNTHDLLVAETKAAVALQYTVAVRDKIIDAYKELMLTVELGRTKKSISEILDFGPGKIIELNKLAGEPIDILVNGKYVAKGEVVVIEESFGVRITEIVNSKINTGKTK